MSYEDAIDLVGRVIDGVGVAVIAAGAVVALSRFAAALVTGGDRRSAYRDVRHRTGRSIVLGLELLVAGDIIRTVAVTPTFSSLGALAVIVAIRTFIAVMLEVELEGRWPWQRA